MANHQVTRCLADIDAMVGISRMAQDTLVFFVESVHSSPGECHACLEFARVGRQANVLPRWSRRDLLLWAHSSRLDAPKSNKPPHGLPIAALLASPSLSTI
jgi:hypothetical protein